jgi:hypothetical protein
MKTAHWAFLDILEFFHIQTVPPTFVVLVKLLKLNTPALHKLFGLFQGRDIPKLIVRVGGLLATHSENKEIIKLAKSVSK